MFKLTLLIINIATSQGCHITDIEYAWSIGPAPPIPLMKNNTPADWAVPHTHPPDATDEPKPEECLPQQNTIYNMSWVMGAATELSTNTWEECQEECEMMESCQAWHWIKYNASSVSVCQLLPEVSQTIATDNPFSYAGVKNCGDDQKLECTVKLCGARGRWSECSEDGKMTRNFEGDSLKEGCTDCPPLTTDCQYQKTDCLEKGIKYLGFKLLKPGTTRNSWATYGEMPDPAQCQALCAKTEGCGWFNHSTTGCFLKTKQGTGTREADGATSGPPKCS